MKTEINMFLLSIEHLLSGIRGPRYSPLKKVYVFVGHPVSERSSKGVLRQFQRCVKEVSRMFKENINWVSRIFLKNIQGCFKNLSIKFCIAILL